MAALKQASVQNKILSLLPPADFEQLAPDLSHVLLPQGSVLATRHQPIDSIYFLTSGIGSVVVTTPDGHRAEAGLFGFDGYVPATAVTGGKTSCHDVNIQVAAEAYRIDYDLFRHRMDNSRNLTRLMTCAIEAFAVQLAYTAVSNAVHNINERLARWLLMCHDRMPGNEIVLTHEYISIMLAVRRPSVTTSLHMLAGHGFITNAERGVITIPNRRALEEFAHAAYGRPEEEFRRLMKELF